MCTERPLWFLTRRDRRWLCLVLALCYVPSGWQAASKASAPSLSGSFVLRAESLRMGHLHLRLPEMEMIEYTGKEETDSADWRVSLSQASEQPDVWQLRLDLVTDVVRRRVEYLMTIEHEESATPTLVPVIAMETALEIETDLLLYRAQTIDWTTQAAHAEKARGIDLRQTATWVLENLDEVHSPEILDVCTDYFGHYPDPSGAEHGFAASVACIKRRIQIDPQDIEAYTLSAWLLWSDWVTWKLHPERIPQGQHMVEEAVRLIKLGRAANPASAAFHLDAAQTLEPLARHHRPELMPFVIRYYRYADALATEAAMQVRIRLNLGHRYRQQGQTEEAINWYERVLQVDPQNRVAHRFLDRLKSKMPAQAKPDGIII